ncbi:hypothetical protein B0H67DRAFT_642005 [Lasiosphaeris hirsuta]|uniref:Uncharacterized protein n=1 Tax=Lasiosphaeris hirsuta TaxID=260670 RepID=A0AA40E6B3_9PEZI|nr:hypothetical protein B0H67DRAFT_642005 [Lasiosphaeris hirsuta]
MGALFPNDQLLSLAGQSTVPFAFLPVLHRHETTQSSLDDLPLGIAQNYWNHQGYHAHMSFGMGASSTFLSALVGSGKIVTRAWSIFWGRQGATQNTQLDGSIVPDAPCLMTLPRDPYFENFGDYTNA